MFYAVHQTMMRHIGDIELLKCMYVYLECFDRSKNAVVQIMIRSSVVTFINAGMGDVGEINALFRVNGELG